MDKYEKMIQDLIQEFLEFQMDLNHTQIERVEKLKSLLERLVQYKQITRYWVKYYEDCAVVWLFTEPINIKPYPSYRFVVTWLPTELSMSDHGGKIFT